MCVRERETERERQRERGRERQRDKWKHKLLNSECFQERELEGDR